MNSCSGQEMVSIMKSVEDLILMGDELPEEEEEEDNEAEGQEGEESGDDNDDDEEDDDEEEEEDSLAGSHNAPAGSSFDYFSSVGNQSHQVSCQFHWPLREIRGYISIHIDSSCGRIKLDTESNPKGVSFSSLNI